MFEKKADLVAVHKEAENFKLENQVKERSPIPFHPGALKYFAGEGRQGVANPPLPSPERGEGPPSLQPRIGSMWMARRQSRYMT